MAHLVLCKAWVREVGTGNYWCGTNAEAICRGANNSMIQFRAGRAYKLPVAVEDATTTSLALSSISVTASAISSSTKAPIMLNLALPNTNQHLSDYDPHPSGSEQRQKSPKEPELALILGIAGYQVISDIESIPYLLLSLLAMTWLAFCLYDRRRRNKIRKEATCEHEKLRYSPVHGRSSLRDAAFSNSLGEQRKNKRVLNVPVDLGHVV